MKCLIIGGAGFIGSHLAEGLLEEGHAVRIFDRANVPLPLHLRSDPRIECLEGDFLNVDDVSRSVNGVEVVFHLASATLPKSSNDNPVYDIQNNVVGSLHLLDIAHSKGVRLIVFASSGGTVYGLPKELPINENHPTNPLVSYGVGKLAIEKYLHLYKRLYGLDYCVLRLSNPFGPRQSGSSGQGAVSVFLQCALRGKSIDIWGDGTVIRDYVYIKDVVGAFIRVLDWHGEQRIFNIGTGLGLSLNDLLEEIETLLGKTVGRNYRAKRSFDVPANILDISMAQKKLGWEPQVSFRSALAYTLNSMREVIVVRE